MCCVCECDRICYFAYSANMWEKKERSSRLTVCLSKARGSTDDTGYLVLQASAQFGLKTRQAYPVETLSFICSYFSVFSTHAFNISRVPKIANTIPRSRLFIRSFLVTTSNFFFFLSLHGTKHLSSRTGSEVGLVALSLDTIVVRHGRAEQAGGGGGGERELRRRRRRHRDEERQQQQREKKRR